MTSELKACPLCGGEARAMGRGSGFIYCECGCEMRARGDGNNIYDDAQAAAAWNTRHPAPLSEENVERVARALWARLYDDPPLKWPGLTHPDAECIVEDARAAITALSTTQESNR